MMYPALKKYLFPLGLAVLIWYLPIAFLAGFVGGLDGPTPSLFEAFIHAQLICARLIFQASEWRQFSLFTLYFSPFFCIPLVTALVYGLQTFLRKKLHLRPWAQAIGCWYLLAGIVYAIFLWQDVPSQSALAVFYQTGTALLIGPVFVFGFVFSGPGSGSSQAQAWLVAVASLPFIWVPVFGYLLKRRAKKRAPTPV